MYKLVGKEFVNYVSKKTKFPVVGQYWYLVSDAIDTEKIVGSISDKVYIPQKILDTINEPPLNSYVKIYYNKFGSVEGVAFANV